MLKKNFLSIVAFVLLTIALLAVVLDYLSGAIWQGHVLNADMLYLPTVFADVFSHGGHLRDWYLTPAPYFFPDFLLYWPAYVLGKTTYSQIIIFTTLQISLMFVLIWFIARQVVKNDPAIASVLITLVLLCFAFTAQGTEPFVLLLVSACHFGGFLAGLFFVGFWLYYDKVDRANKRLRYGLLFLLMAVVFWATLSDNLFTLQVTLPFVITLFVLNKLSGISFRKDLLALLFLTTVGSWIFYSVTVPFKTHSFGRMSLSKIPEQAGVALHFFWDVITQNGVYAVVFVMYLICSIYLFRRLKENKRYPGPLSKFVLFCFSSFALSACLSLLIYNLTTVRYQIPSFFWPVVVIGLVLPRIFGKYFRWVGVILSFFFIAPWSIHAYKMSTLKRVSSQYYPDEIACIDHALEKTGLTQGIAPYWQAKPMQNFSRLKLNIAQYYDDVSPQAWITSKNYFKKRYDFAIINTTYPSDKLPAESVIYLNGLPKETVVCGRNTLLIYGKNQLRVEKFDTAGDSYLWKGWDLKASKLTIKSNDGKIKKRVLSSSGRFTFGPPVTLSDGEYLFELSYNSSDMSSEPIGSWSLVVPSDNFILRHFQGKSILQQGVLVGTQDKQHTITGRFIVDHNHFSPQVRLHTVSYTNKDLEIDYLKITKLK